MERIERIEATVSADDIRETDTETSTDTAHHLAYYRFAGWEGVRHGIFTRLGGVSAAPFDSLNMGGTVGDSVQAVHDNHALMYAALGVSMQRTVTVWMVHGVDTVIAHAPLPNRRWLAQADAIITDQPELALVMRYADCTPIMAYDAGRGVIGIAHAGWQGTVHGMARHMIEAMVQAYGCRPADLRAGIGASIGPERYQVGAEVVAAAQAYYGTLESDSVESAPLVQHDPTDGTAYLNLWEANRRDLRNAGVEQIDIMGLCTATHTDEWFSHRAEKGKTGRFGAVLMLG